MIIKSNLTKDEVASMKIIFCGLRDNIFTELMKQQQVEDQQKIFDSLEKGGYLV